MRTRYKPPVWPWEPPEIEEQELFALRALQDGVANQGQQKMALATIVQKFAATYDMTFRPGGEDGRRATDFAAGKAFVGQRIIEALTRPMKPRGGQDAGTTEPTAADRRNPKPAAVRGKPAKPATGKPAAES